MSISAELARVGHSGANRESFGRGSRCLPRYPKAHSMTAFLNEDHISLSTSIYVCIYIYYVSVLFATSLFISWPLALSSFVHPNVDQAWTYSLIWKGTGLIGMAISYLQYKITDVKWFVHRSALRRWNLKHLAGRQLSLSCTNFDHCSRTFSQDLHWCFGCGVWDCTGYVWSLCANRDVDKSHRSGGSETAIASFGEAGILHASGIAQWIGLLDVVGQGVK